MLPSIELQIGVVIAALKDVVGPAIDPNNAPATEQLHLALATLAMVKQRLPFLHSVARVELLNAVNVAVAAFASGAQTLEAEVASAREALENPTTPTSVLDAVRAKVLGVVSGELRANHHAGDRSIARAVLAASKPQFDLSRAWCITSGFELDPQEIPTLESLLAVDSKR